MGWLLMLDLKGALDFQSLLGREYLAAAASPIAIPQPLAKVRLFILFTLGYQFRSDFSTPQIKSS